jgi:hypothetical protein
LFLSLPNNHTAEMMDVVAVEMETNLGLKPAEIIVMLDFLDLFVSLSSRPRNQ